MLIGLLGYCIQQSSERLADLRNSWLLQAFASLSLGSALAAWAGGCCALTLAAGALVQCIAPKAAGAGVPPVKVRAALAHAGRRQENLRPSRGSYRHCNTPVPGASPALARCTPPPTNMRRGPRALCRRF